MDSQHIENSQAKNSLFFVEVSERFCYWGLQSILVLFLTKIFLFPDSKAYALYGAYTAFTFALSVVGGVVADKLTGFRVAVILGVLLEILGNVFLTVTKIHFVYRVS